MTEANLEQREYWNGAESREWADAPERFDQMLEPFADSILDAAALAPGERVLDVGCGNGATTLAAAAHVGETGAALGVDLSEPMLANARARATERGITNARFVAADAQVTALPGRFDVIVSRFGVMFFEDPDAAWSNLVGSLAPNGRVVLMCWRSVLENEWVAVQAQAAFAHVPPPAELASAELASGGPGPFRYGDPAPLVRSLERAGLHDVAATPIDATILLGGRGSLEEVLAFVEGSGMTRRLLDGAPPEQEARALVAVREALAPYATDEGVRLGAAAWLVTGRRR
jgi:SAM-dependent methyltransferase